MAPAIYVEILIRAPMDALWAHTQLPRFHERWDARFSTIDYLPKAHPDAPQHFRYSTRLGFGLRIDGDGESSGQRNLPDGSRASSLRFGSDAWLSLIRDGAGYWKYIPAPDGVRFLKVYDYRTRFGVCGAMFDRFVFRPLIGWATAWSFDRLRLWLEQHVDPAHALRLMVVRVAARVAIVALLAGLGLMSADNRDGATVGITAAAIASLIALDLAVSYRVPSAARCARIPGRRPR